MPGSFRLGTFAGIDIYINYSWLIILVFLIWSLATNWFAVLYPGWLPALYWITSTIAALLLFVSVLLHELAHSVVARARGLSVKNITLFIFGGVSNIEQEPKSPGVEFQVAIVGYHQRRAWCIQPRPRLSPGRRARLAFHRLENQREPAHSHTRSNAYRPGDCLSFHTRRHLVVLRRKCV